jgi:alpha-N-dichloroacetyl-p-aminophenylserinol N-oxygenase
MYTHVDDGRAGAGDATAPSSRVGDILSQTWANRVAARTSQLDLGTYYDAEQPDYPIGMVPFRDDPRYLALDPGMQRRVLAAAWINYNEKTISVEKSIVAPACELLLCGAFRGVETSVFKRTIAQTAVDEQYHVLMCLEACLVARERHQLESLRIPKSLVVSELERELASCARPRDAELVQLAFSTVAEVTINAYLDLLADDRTIQPLNREITALHRKDESSHSKLFKEFTRALYPRLSAEEQGVYLRGLTAGLDAFVKLDLSAWAAILRHLEVPGADGIIADCERSSASKRVVRDFSGLRALLRDIDVKEAQLAFRFEEAV